MMTSPAWNRWPWLLGIAACLIVPRPFALSAENAAPPPADTDEEARLNWPTPTLGGAQLWTDELVFHAWRIQRNTLTGHYRLLDDHDVRRAWGTFEQCRTRLDELRSELHLPPHPPHVVVVLHGLGRTRHSMEGLCQYVRNHTGFTVLSVGYASTREGLREHAAAFAKVLRNLTDVREVSLVAHSMGNIVARRYLAEPTPTGAAPPKMRRFVMLAPPNNGAQLARRLRDNRLFALFFGTSGQELGQATQQLEGMLATPTCEFGIIAGGKGDDAGRNPLLDGDDDLVVSVAETRLPGARDFIVAPVLHTVIMDNPTVQEYTVRFLQEGYFVSEDRRCPISP